MGKLSIPYHWLSFRLQSRNRQLINLASRRNYIQRPEGWESIIGLEVHAQIDRSSKLFSSASAKYGGSVNTQVALFDAAIPGTLPVLNRSCVEAALLTSAALSCRINEVSYFDRKHYFYADLPAGYQITQQRKAVANDGRLKFVVFSPGVHKAPYYQTARIHQIQLEQDSGKSIHDDIGDRSLIDLNRAGVPLMEIVFEPDLKDGEEAGALIKELSLILQSLGTCNCKMEEGSLRVDANISVNRVGEPLGTRAEVKNINTIRALVNSIEFEVQRQINVLEGGGVVVNETRSYDSISKQTLPMRDKEVKQDYRFMPEPNLPPLRVQINSTGQSNAGSQPNTFVVSELTTKIVELPDSKRTRLVQNYGLRLDTALTIVNTPGCLDYFESVMKCLGSPDGQKPSHILLTVVIQFLYNSNITFENSPMSPESFAELYQLIADGKLNLDKAKEVVDRLFQGDKRSPLQIVTEENMTMIGDDEAITALCSQIMLSNPKIVAKYRNTKHEKHINKLMGQIRKATDGKLNMYKADQCLRKLLLQSEK